MTKRIYFIPIIKSIIIIFIAIIIIIIISIIYLLFILLFKGVPYLGWTFRQFKQKFAPLDLSRNKSKGKSRKNIKVLTI